MDSLIEMQTELSSRMHKAQINYKKCAKDKKTVQYVESRLENLDSLWKQFSINHSEIIKTCKPEELKKTNYIRDDLYDSTEEFYIEFRSELKQRIDAGRSPSGNQDSKEKGENSQIKLPKIVILTFSGDYLEWPTFRDLFVSLVHENRKVDDVQKLHYLKGYLTGEAEQLIRQIPITGSNYMRCWELLETRYNNKKYLARCILKRMLSQKSLNSESASQLKELLDTTSDCLSSLTNIGVDVSNWDIIVIHLLTLKLDVESRKQWELSINNDNASDELPTFVQFKEFISNRYRALEFLDTRSTTNRHSTQANITNKQKTFHVTRIKCEYCNDDHKLSFCKGFAKETVDNRRNFVERNRLCFNCLGAGHSVKFCKGPRACRVCKRKHHSLLHSKSETEGSSIAIETKSVPQSGNASGVASGKQASSSQATVSQSEVTCHASTSVHSQVLLATALVLVEANTGNKQLVRALIDQGSQASFVTESTVQALGIKKTPVEGNISGLEGSKNVSCKHRVKLVLSSLVEPTVTVMVHAYVLKTITTHLPSQKVCTLNWPELERVPLADPQYHTPHRVDMLLGAEVYSQIIQEGIKRDPSGFLIAQCSTFGWILSGVIDTSLENNVMAMHVTVNENELLKKFWEQETDKEFENKLRFTEEEKKCEEIYAATTTRDSNGRYLVDLPFKEENPSCQNGNSRDIAMRRFIQLEKRFTKDPHLREEYRKVIKEYLDLGHMEVVPKEQLENEKAVYLPHHAVVREDKTTSKVRVVFDASCPGTNGASLNNNLLVGPTLQPDLRHLIMRWRKYPICLVADVVKMYRQIKVNEHHIDFQRLFWRDSPDAEMQHLRLLRVTFGTASAPYLAVRTLQQLAYDEGEPFPYAKERVLKEFYMDDLLTGCQSVEEGRIIYQQMKELLEKGGFSLQKWNSSSKELMQEMCKESDEETSSGREIKIDAIMKILGLTWKRNEDEFNILVQLPKMENPITKRKVISDIARLFDPLGWLAPVIVSAKVFIQKLWLAGIDWDEKLPSQLLKEWLSYRKVLNKLSTFRLPRWINMRDDDIIQELHGFTDASNVAYAAVVYCRTVDKQGEVHVNLITAKTRVAPISNSQFHDSSCAELFS